MFDFRLLLPKTIDNTFLGNKFSLWFFYLITAVTLWRSQHHLFSEDGGVQTIATIPLNTYGAGASSTVIGIFALWGISQLIIGFIYLLSCLRYRALIPLLYFLGIVEYSFRAFYVAAFKPIETIGDAPGAIINLPFIAVFSLMLLLALWRKDETKT